MNVFFKSYSLLDRPDAAEEVCRDAAGTRKRLGDGEILVVRKFISGKECRELIDYLTALQPEAFADRLHMVEGCRDAIQKVDTSGFTGGYRTVNRSFYFFKFNKSQGPQAKISERMHSVQKRVSGMDASKYSANTPKDLVIDRTEIIQYPMDTGFVSCHSDPDDTMKVNVGLYLTEYGKDYCGGGFYVIGGDGSRTEFDRNVKAGDLIMWYPTVPHGVNPPTYCGQSTVRKDTDGRWFMSVNSVWSHLSKERPKAMPWG